MSSWLGGALTWVIATKQPRTEEAAPFDMAIVNHARVGNSYGAQRMSCILALLI